MFPGVRNVGMGVAIKRQQNDPFINGTITYLDISMSITWLLFCSTVLLDVSIKGNQLSCIISYDHM